MAKTGKGHGTDEVIKKTFFPYACEVEFNYIFSDIPHPNTMELISYKKNEEQERKRVFSIGGGSIEFENAVVALTLDEKADALKQFVEDFEGNEK